MVKPKEKLPEKLLTGPEDKSDIYQGWLHVAPGAGKKWKKLFCVMRYDYTIECFEDELPAPVEGAEEEGAEKPKMPKLIEEIFPYNLHVVAGEECTPKKEMEGCFGLVHERRLHYFLKSEEEEEHKEWKRLLEIAEKNAPAPINRDWVARKTFEVAYRRTRWWSGLYGSYTLDAPEKESFGFLVYDIVIKELSDELPASGFMKKLADRTIRKSIDTTCAASWKAVQTAITTVREQLEEPIKTGVAQMNEVEETVKAKLDELVMDKMREEADKLIAPHLAKMVDVIRDPLVEGFNIFLHEWNERAVDLVKKVEEGADIKREIRDKEYDFHWSYWRAMDKPCRALDKLEDKLGLVGELIPHLYTWQFIRSAYRIMMRLAKKAFFTIGQLVEDATRDGTVEVKDAVKGAFETTKGYLEHDAKLFLNKYFNDKLFKVFWHPIDKTVMKLLGELIKPLEDAVPSPIDKFFSPEDILEDYVKAFIAGICGSAVDTSAKAAIDGLGSDAPLPAESSSSSSSSD